MSTSNFTLLLSSVMSSSSSVMFQVQSCLTSTETIRAIRDWEPSPVKFNLALHPQRPYGLLGTFTQLLISVVFQIQSCFTSTETVRAIRDGGAQDVHLEFHIAPELSTYMSSHSRGV